MMSVLVQRCSDSKIILYTKGADSSIFPRLISNKRVKKNIDSHLNDFEKDGYRVLCAAKRLLVEDEALEVLSKLKDND